MKTEPHPNCRRCPRLHRFIGKYRRLEPHWHNAPVPNWLPEAGHESVKLLIVGLAPGLRGANKSGRAFTGDASGEVLFATLLKCGLAQGTFENHPGDNLQLIDCAITNAVRCVPPENRPKGSEINNCRQFLARSIARLPNLRAIVTLGKIAHDSTLRALGARVADYPFSHNKAHSLEELTLVSSYHCSRYNMNTGRLTTQMFEEVFLNVRRSIY